MVSGSRYSLYTCSCTCTQRASVSSSAPQAPRKRVFHALSDAPLAGTDDSGPALAAAVQELLAALEPAVPAMLAQLQRLEPDGAATAAMSDAVAAAAAPARPVSAPVRTRGLLPQHVARRPVIADLAAASAANTASRNRSSRSLSPVAVSRHSAAPTVGQFSIGGADLAAFSRDAPLAAAAVAAAKPRASSPAPKRAGAPATAVEATPSKRGLVAKELSAEEFSDRLHAELRENLAAAAAEPLGVGRSASADAQDAAELADEIRAAVLAWRARTDP